MWVAVDGGWWTTNGGLVCSTLPKPRLEPNLWLRLVLPRTDLDPQLLALVLKGGDLCLDFLGFGWLRAEGVHLLMHLFELRG